MKPFSCPPLTLNLMSIALICKVCLYTNKVLHDYDILICYRYSVCIFDVMKLYLCAQMQVVLAWVF